MGSKFMAKDLPQDIMLHPDGICLDTSRAKLFGHRPERVENDPSRAMSRNLVLNGEVLCGETF